ncbi:cytochrome C oxidase subunit IV family protein [Thauera sinica]|uniref:Cytochrome C oxidase subunit IV family protein n=1 Tax=Thauera sinica TaxID=2665146 RepID=A0ABW1AQI4_9RHOO|nr:cytochrome C oxidase subunit IV family protein [Thauera sp. K11]ATE59702.1 hypothetical protein CCZ27_06830 [Thauera sp. K11]
MSTEVHGTPRRATVLWLLLIAATLLTWGMGATDVAGRLTILLLAVLSFWKGSVVILDFMALRHAPLLWRALTLGWMILVWALIAIAYWKGIAR